jgi:hypothetical protein
MKNLTLFLASLLIALPVLAADPGATLIPSLGKSTTTKPVSLATLASKVVTGARCTLATTACYQASWPF